jgi:hypothetical protein
MKNLPSYMIKMYNANMTYVWLPDELTDYQIEWLDSCGYEISRFFLGGVIVKIRD